MISYCGLSRSFAFCSVSEVDCILHCGYSYSFAVCSVSVVGCNLTFRMILFVRFLLGIGGRLRPHIVDVSAHSLSPRYRR